MTEEQRAAKRIKNKAYHAANRERRLAAMKAYRARDTEADRQRCKDWRDANIEYARARERAYYAKNRERVKARTAAYQARNSEARRDSKQKHDAKRRGGDDLAVAYRKVVRNDPCAYCGAPNEHVDHIVPVSKDGSNAWDNLTSACRKCNMAKSDTSLLFILQRW